MTTKIEEVARAIGEAKAEDEPPLQYVLIRGYTAMGYALPSGAAIDAVNVATRAAIEAIRKWELTDSECDAGFQAGMFAGHGPEDPRWNAMRRIFPAIIDAALNEGKE